MGEVFIFHPNHRQGVIFNILAVLVTVALVGVGIWLFFQANTTLALLYLLPGLAAVALLPALLYRLYALQNATYQLESDGIHLRWGLRAEDIPMSDILWVHPESDVTGSLPRPWLHWPGAVMGLRRIPGGGVIEYLAASSRGLILIATSHRFFAITPADPQRFLQSFQRLTEMGSLAPFEARSVYPAFLIGRVWAALPARLLIIAGVIFSLALVIFVGLAIPSRSQIHLGFKPDQSPGDLVPAARLFLLPVLSSFFSVVDLFAGLFFYRRNESRPFSYILWGCGALTPLLFIVAVFLLLRAG